MNAYRNHLTSDLLRIERATAALAVRQELERRGYAYDAACGRFVKNPTVVCRMCGATHQSDRSCDCFDNGCQ